jgi:hypothetical protein
LIDEVRISREALTKEELLFNDGQPPKAFVCGHWVFEDQPGIFKDSAGVQGDLAKTVVKKNTPVDPGLVDLCHVILNSDGFLYLD